MTVEPETAVVLAAGKGRRLWPLTENRPKPMIPVANRPILEHIVAALEDAGVSEVVFVVGSNRERIQNHFEEGQAWDLEISYAIQEKQLGTGHALLQAEPHIGTSFLALNGDRIIESALLTQVWERHQRTGDPAIGVTRVAEPSRYGVVDLDGDHLVGIEEQPPPDRAASEFINAGVYAFDPDIFAALRRTDSRGEQALTDTLVELLSTRRIQAVNYRGLWIDVSVPWDLLEVNELLLDRQVSTHADGARLDQSAVVADATALGEGVVVHPQAAVLRGAALGDNVRVQPGAIVENAIILRDSTLKSGAVVTDCIVGANTTVGAGTVLDGASADVVLDAELYQDVAFGGLLGDNVELGTNVTVQPGTIVGNDAIVEGAAVVSGTIEDGTHVLRG